VPPPRIADISGSAFGSRRGASRRPLYLPSAACALRPASAPSDPATTETPGLLFSAGARLPRGAGDLTFAVAGSRRGAAITGIPVPLRFGCYAGTKR